MIGPDRHAKGGIASVVNGYYEAGLSALCNVCYIGTNSGSGKLQKFYSAVKAFFKFSQEIKQTDLVHIHMSSRMSYERKKHFISVAKKHKKPYIIHMHSGEWKKYIETECTPGKVKEIRSVFADAAKVIVLSQEWQEYFSNEICDALKIVVLNNSVSIPHIKATDNCSDSRHNVLFLGRLSKNKNPDDLIRAAQHVVAKHPRIQFRFAGDGDNRVYRQLADERGVADNCEFLGWVSGEKREQLFLDSGIFCLPSQHEGMPMGVLEAMSYGLVPVVTPVGGIPQIVEEGISGFFMPVGDEAALTSALLTLIEDRSLQTRMGLAARDKIIHCFSAEQGIKNLVNIYDDLISLEESRCL